MESTMYGLFAENRDLEYVCAGHCGDDGPDAERDNNDKYRVLPASIFIYLVYRGPIIIPFPYI